MAVEIGPALGLTADSSTLVVATEDLKNLTKAAGGAQAAADKLAPSEKKVSDEAKKLGDNTRKAASDTEKLGKESRTTEGYLHALSGSMGSVVGRLAAMAGAALSVAGYVKLADTWSDLRSQLGAAIGDMDGASRMMRRMVDIANASYSPLDQTVQVYARNVSVLRALGKSSAEAADFTEALNHALVITATKGEQATSVQNALSKAMAVGKLQADGLETVLANGGKVAEVLAEHLGTSVNGLRKLASDGKITGDVIASALIGRLDELRVIAADMPATVGDAFTRLTTNVTQFVGELDQATGISASMSEAIMLVADNIDMVAGYVVAAAAGISALFIPALWGAVTATASLVAGLITLKGALIATGIGAFVVAAGTLIGKFLELVRVTGSFSGAIASLGEVWDAAKNYISAGALALGDVFSGITNRIKAYFSDAWAAVLRGFAAMMSAIQGGINKMIDGLNSISVDMPGWMGGGTVGFNIPVATFADGFSVMASDANRAAMSLHSAADAAIELAGTRLDNIESPVAALNRLLSGGDDGSTTDQGSASNSIQGTAGGGGKGRGKGLSGLIGDLATEIEKLNLWYQEKLALIQQYSDQELAIIGGRLGAIERLEAEHNLRMREIQDQERQYTQSAQEGMYGALIGMMDAFGGKSKGLAMAALALNTWLRVRETLQNTAAASVRALAELGPIAGPPAAAKIMTYGKVQAALIAASGVASAAGAGGGGGASGGGASAGGVAQSQSTPETPLRVSVDAFDPNQLYTGAAVQQMFNLIQKEAGNRGIQWVPTN